ncbi:ABC transporter substrate-binding protein [Agrobacterium sp. NPDC090273]|uniref:urea ABC transporter substrate-binding protein n=1 Tax=Agrobacterium sp. NPDC090273 TaxID=3363919 RepID=UPI00383ACE97
METTRRRFLGTTGIAATALFAPGILRNAQAADPILVGSLHDQSGPLAANGIPMVEALKLGIGEINAKGGLLGRELKLIHYDPQSDNQIYTQYAQQIAVRDKANVVFGGITSSSREAIRPVFSRFKTLYFYGSLYEGGVCDRNTFCTGTTPAQTVQKLVPFAMENSGKKVYIVGADYNFGQISAKWMQKFVRDNGGETLAVEFFPLDVNNFGATISKIQAAKPDLVLSVLVGGNHISFYRQWTAAGMKGQIPIASSSFGLYNEPQVLDQAETEGVYGTFGYFEELETDANKQFVSKLKAQMPAIPYLSETAATSYEGLYLWAKAVEKAGTVDRVPVIEALESGISFDGPSGKVTIDHQTHHTIRNTFLAQVKDRKWNVIKSYPDAKPEDTASVCNLIENPNENKQFEISL